jgi:hypothetical protein
MFGKHKEIERTCSRCQTVWYLPLKDQKSKGPSGTTMRGARMMAAGSTMSLGSRHESADQMRVSRLEAAKERADTLRTCPSCGSGKFKDKIVS